MKTICIVFLAIIFIESANAETMTGIANPASVYCINKGGRLEIRKTPGGEVGYCIFPDGTECEEWGFFRGEKCIEKKGFPKSEWVPFKDYSRIIGVWINEKFLNTLNKTYSVPIANKGIKYSLVNITKNNITDIFSFHESLDYLIEKIEYNPSIDKIKIFISELLLLFPSG
ncbi:MAG: DUF333 domain-containing protein [Desulfobacterales bacterium]|nr:DUF333 domain-containing protein [Desulfobacterales bacterium]